jgi:hypothetical protein
VKVVIFGLTISSSERMTARYLETYEALARKGAVRKEAVHAA